jgi:hypothetical protein
MMERNPLYSLAKVEYILNAYEIRCENLKHKSGSGWGHMVDSVLTVSKLTWSSFKS